MTFFSDISTSSCQKHHLLNQTTAFKMSLKGQQPLWIPAKAVFIIHRCGQTKRAQGKHAVLL